MVSLGGPAWAVADGPESRNASTSQAKQNGALTGRRSFLKRCALFRSVSARTTSSP